MKDHYTELAKSMALDARFSSQVTKDADTINGAFALRHLHQDPELRSPFAGREDFWWAFVLGWLYANNIKIPQTQKHYDRFIQNGLI